MSQKAQVARVAAQAWVLFKNLRIAYRIQAGIEYRMAIEDDLHATLLYRDFLFVPVADWFQMPGLGGEDVVE